MRPRLRSFTELTAHLTTRTSDSHAALTKKFMQFYSIALQLISTFGNVSRVLSN